MTQQSVFQLKPLTINGQEVTASIQPNEAASRIFACIAAREMFEQDPPSLEDIGEGTPQSLFNQVSEVIQRQYLLGGADEKEMVYGLVARYLEANPDVTISKMLSYAKEHPPEVMIDDLTEEGGNARKRVVDKAFEKRKKKAAQRSRARNRRK